MKKGEHFVQDQEAQERIDKLLATILEDGSRTQIQTWIKAGNITVNDQSITPNYRCKPKDHIKWDIPKTEEILIQPEKIPLSILYEDDHLLVVDKPRGMVIHPSQQHRKGTLVNALLNHTSRLSNLSGDHRPGIVHRLDRNTSGVVVVAKNNTAHQHLVEQFQKRTVKRIYEALVHGTVKYKTGTIDAPIGRNPRNRRLMGVVEGGKRAVTHYTILNRFKAYSHIECQLETGRMHQIRVHMQYIGHPIVGDLQYGKPSDLNGMGQALFAKSLTFIHPNEKRKMTFKTETPPYFRQLLHKIKKQS